MSLLARHRYIVQHLTDAFGYGAEDAVEQMMLVPEVLQVIDHFFTADGPIKIIVTIVEEKLKEKGGKSRNRKLMANAVQPTDSKCLKVYTDEVDIIPNIAVFFMKNKRHPNDTDKISVDPTKANDGTLGFGIIRGPLKTLEVLMRCVYRPMIQQMDSESWGDTTLEQRNEFINSIDSFSKGLETSIRNLSGGIELTKPDERVETMGHLAANDPELVVRSLNLLDDWCRSIEVYLDDSDRSRWENLDSGPDTELIFWRSRMQRYVSCWNTQR